MKKREKFKISTPDELFLYESCKLMVKLGQPLGPATSMLLARWFLENVELRVPPRVLIEALDDFKVEQVSRGFDGVVRTVEKQLAESGRVESEALRKARERHSLPENEINARAVRQREERLDQLEAELAAMKR